MFQRLAILPLATTLYRFMDRLEFHWVMPREPELPPPEEPEPFRYDNFTPIRGAVRKSQHELIRLRDRMSGPLFHLAGVFWSAIESLNKLIFITGRPGSGKTTVMRLAMASASNLFRELPAMAESGRIPGKGNMRWLVIDPTDAYLPYLYQILPSEILIVRASPHDLFSARWDIARDVQAETDIMLLETAMFPDSLFTSSADSFWPREARSLFGDVIRVFVDRGSDWRFADALIPLYYPQYLKPLLAQSRRTRHNNTNRLVGKLGRDITITASSVIRSMAVAAALWDKAKNTFSIEEFLKSRSVLHFSYKPSMIPALSGVANALSHMLVIKATERKDPYDFTTLWLDEARYLSDLGGLDDLVARGRGAGLGAVVSAQGLPGLISKWKEGRVKEFRDLINTWVTLTAGDETAEAFSRFVGKVEGIQRSWSTSESETSGYSSPECHNYITEALYAYAYPGPPARGSYNSSTSNSKSESFQMVTKDAILPSEIMGLPMVTQERPLLEGFAYSPNTGCFDFTSSFIPFFDSLIDPPFKDIPQRPAADQILMPWNEHDIARLNLEPTPKMIEAIKVSSKGTHP